MKRPDNSRDDDSVLYKLVAKIVFKAIDMSTYSLFVAWFVLIILIYILFKHG